MTMYELKNIEFKNGIKGKQIFIDANSELGFNNPYMLFIPDELKYMTLLVKPVNTGKGAKTLEEARDNNLIEVTRNSFNMRVAYALKMPLLIPLFPRLAGYDTHMLTSTVYNNDMQILFDMNKRRNEDESTLSEEEILEIKQVHFDIPKQLVRIISHSREVFETLNINISEKVIIEGYSAAGMFASYFTALCPEIIEACVSGGTCGLGILPTDKLKDITLKYPLGIADIPGFNLEKFLNVPQLFYIGDQDYNDPAMVKCNYLRDKDGNYIIDSDGYKVPKTDENGQIVPVLNAEGKIQAQYPDCYTDKEVELIHTFLGTNPQERFTNQEKLYQEFGVNVIFKKLSGTHKTIFTNRDENNNLAPEILIKKFYIFRIRKKLQ